MDILLPAVIFVLVVIWAFRVEIGIAKANEALARIEKLLADKKEKK